MAYMFVFASAFNQPLSFDTSSVTNMQELVAVRSARAPASSLHSRVLCQRPACAAAAAPRSPASRPASRPSAYASLSTRQNALAFNQPLSFDTSRVTNMQYMFYVRSSRVPPPAASTVGSSASTLLAPPPPPHALPPPGPHLAPLPMCFPFHSAEYPRVVCSQQASHPLRMGGHLGLRTLLLSELGSGDLPDSVGCISLVRRTNKVLNRCAWAGNTEFVTRYGSAWSGWGAC